MDEITSHDELDEFSEFLACEANHDEDYPFTSAVFREPLFMYMVYDAVEEELVPFNFHKLERSFLGLSRDFHGYLCFRSKDEAYAEIVRLSEKANMLQLHVVEVDFGQITDEQTQVHQNNPTLFADFAIGVGNRRAVGFKSERTEYLSDAFNYFQEKELFEQYVTRLFSGAKPELCIADEMVQTFSLLVLVKEGTANEDWEFGPVEVLDGQGALIDFNVIVSTGESECLLGKEAYPVDFGVVCKEYLERDCEFDLILMMGEKSFKITREICERVVFESDLIENDDIKFISGYLPICDYSAPNLSEDEVELMKNVLDDCGWIRDYRLYSGTIEDERIDVMEIELYDVTEPNLDELISDLRRAVSGIAKNPIQVIGRGIPPVNIEKNIPQKIPMMGDGARSPIRGIELDALGLAGAKLTNDLHSNRHFN